ncbi:hypothetical protein [Micromonospora sp. NPDC050495]|uniref:hypothetical protein n=1 Tax=Micromonospora sp. NPDC050495 TaxID=3154936 RepID=UPI0033EC8DBC
MPSRLPIPLHRAEIVDLDPVCFRVVAAQGSAVRDRAQPRLTPVTFLQPIRLTGQQHAEPCTVVLAVGVGQGFGVALVHADRRLAARSLRRAYLRRVDLVVDLDSGAAQDQAQRPGRGDGRGQRDPDHLAGLETGNRQPQPSLPIDGGVVLVGAHHDLIVRAVVATLPMLAHLPGQERIVSPLVGLQRGEHSFALGRIVGASADRPPDVDLGRLHVRGDVRHGVADGFLPRIRQHGELHMRAVGQPPVPNLPVCQPRPDPGDRAVTLPHLAAHPAQPAGLLHQGGVLARI